MDECKNFDCDNCPTEKMIEEIEKAEFNCGPGKTLKYFRGYTALLKRVRRLQAELKTSKNSTGHYMERARKLKDTNLQLHAESKANEDMAIRYHRENEKLKKQSGRDNPWHNPDDIKEIKLLQAEVAQLKKDNELYKLSDRDCPIGLAASCSYWHKMRNEIKLLKDELKGLREL